MGFHNPHGFMASTPEQTAPRPKEDDTKAARRFAWTALMARTPRASTVGLLLACLTAGWCWEASANGAPVWPMLVGIPLTFFAGWVCAILTFGLGRAVAHLEQ